jgi:replicative DNA helicase
MSAHLSLANPPEIRVPESMEVEQALLGVFLVNNEALYQVPQQFAVEHFYSPLHQRIYAAIRECFDAGKLANPLTLRGRFERDDGIAEMGGVSYLAKLAAHGFVISIPAYCETLIRTWMRRELMYVWQQAVAKLGDETVAPEEVAAIAGKEAIGIVSSASKRVSETDYEVGVRILENLKNPARCQSTGMPRLNTAMGGGLFAKKLYGFAARKKVGKTILAATLSHNLAEQGISHLFICVEMSSEEVLQRILARKTNSFESAFRSDYGKSHDFQDRLAQAVIGSRRCIHFEDKPGISFDELQQVIAAQVMRNGIRGFIMDYWQLVGGKPKNKSMAEHLDDVAQWLASACRKYDIWGVLMAQMNQEGNTRGGEGIRLACDQLYEIHREPITEPLAWLEMMETRYTKWANVGAEGIPGMVMDEKGPFFEECLA